jgi:lysophospholipase L1-like esterase
MRILVFGDSIAQGFWDSQGGWVQRLINEYNEQSLKNMLADTNGYIEMYNLGIAGDTARGVLKRMKYEVKSRRLHVEDEVIVIAIGMNDTMIYKGVNAVPPDLFRDELAQLLESARELTDKVLFIGLTAVDDAACNPWKYSSAEECFNNDRIWQFERITREFCKDENIPHVKIFEKFKKAHEETGLLADGLHPNDAGHALIAKFVKPAIDELVLA